MPALDIASLIISFDGGLAHGVRRSMLHLLSVSWASKSTSPRGVIPSFVKGSRVVRLTGAGYPGSVLMVACMGKR